MSNLREPSHFHQQSRPMMIASTEFKSNWPHSKRSNSLTTIPICLIGGNQMKRNFLTFFLWQKYFIVSLPRQCHQIYNIHRLSPKMAENILLVKANLDIVYLAPSIEDEDDEKEEEALDLDEE
jgi:hypothetical protein